MQVDAMMVLHCLDDLDQKCTDLIRKYTLDGIGRDVNKFDITIALCDLTQEARKLRMDIITVMAGPHAS